jgi:hypothetical protein
MRTMLSLMDSWDSVIGIICGDEQGSLGEVADALGQSLSTVSGWKTRGIPAPHWAAVVALSADRGKPVITLEVLARLAARKLEEAR